MTIDEAVKCNNHLKLFMMAEDAANDTNRFLEESYEALEMGITALRTMELLTERPCSVCKYHGDGCRAWKCPFEEVGNHEQKATNE
jgi:hypothetical protein